MIARKRNGLNPYSEKAGEGGSAIDTKAMEELKEQNKKLASKVAELVDGVAKANENSEKAIVKTQEQMEEMQKVRDHVTRLSTLGGGKKRTLRGGSAASPSMSSEP